MPGRLKRIGFHLNVVSAAVATTPDVLDYSAFRPDPAALVAARIAGVQRYLTTQTSGFGPIKLIRQPEYDALMAAGIAVLLGFENSSTSWQGGRDAGLNHGKAARKMARDLGHPDHRPIAFAVDSGDQVSKVPLAVSYIGGCVDGSNTGPQIVYGGTNVIEGCWNAGLIIGGWKAAAASWSQVPSSHILLEQLLSKSYPQFPPSQYDENRALALDWGQWPLIPPYPLPSGPCDCCCG